MTRFIKTAVLGLCLMVLGMSSAYADKKEDYQKTYNYARAIELVNEEKLDEAEGFFRKEIADHKDNGYAYAWLASLLEHGEKYGEALTNINLAMKYLDKKEAMYSFCFSLRSRIYLSLGEEKKALDDMNTRVKLFPKDADCYESRAEYYVDKDQFELANQDYVMMTKVEPGNPDGYVGSGICLRNLKLYDEAIAQYDYALKLSPQYSRAFAQRGYCYHLMAKYQNAADDAVKSLDIDSDDLAFSLISMVADSAFETMDFKLKIQQMMQPNEPYWLYCRAHIREGKKNYLEAIEMYEKCNSMKFSPVILRRIAECKEEMGDYEGALNAITEGLAADSSDVRMRYRKAQILDGMGRTQDAIDEFTHVIELAPRWGQGYYGRGWVKDMTGDSEGAIEDYTMSIMVNDDNVRSYIRRGVLYHQKGMKDLAKADFEEVLKRDTIPSEYSAAYYAWFYLGERDKAVAAMDSVLAHDEKGSLYDAACLYSLMKESDKALDYLRRAFEDGYSDFDHVGRDSDLDNIRELESFKQMVEEYKQKAHERWGLSPSADSAQPADGGDFDEVIEEIPFTHESGVTKVRCKINDLPLHFVFDTGASDVTISTVEATFMLKNGYLSEKDITGKQSYMTADGNISEGTTINLRKVNFGNLELDNVKASVVKSQNAPLLLGQSVLQRLGKIEIDNGRSVLKVTHRIRK